MEGQATYENLRDVIDTIDCTIESYLLDHNGPYHTYYTNDTAWLGWWSKDAEVTIDGETYKIDTVNENVSVILYNEDEDKIPTSTSFEIEKPFFFFGTFRQASAELNEIEDTKLKLPMIYQHDTTREREDRDPESIIAFESDCDLFFLTENKFAEWRNEEHEEHAIKPMRNLKDRFIYALEHHKSVGYFDNFETFNRVKWGVEEQNGYNKQIFKDNTSGLQLKITIPFKRNLDC